MMNLWIPAREWIPSRKKPNDNSEVLGVVRFADDLPYIDIVTYDSRDKQWTTKSYQAVRVTYWCKLPELPSICDSDCLVTVCRPLLDPAVISHNINIRKIIGKSDNSKHFTVIVRLFSRWNPFSGRYPKIHHCISFSSCFQTSSAASYMRLRPTSRSSRCRMRSTSSRVTINCWPFVLCMVIFPFSDK